jgi:hypothetical protein
MTAKVPTDIASLLNEWDASDLTGSVGDGGAVSSWTDTTSAVALAQATGGNQPLLRHSVTNLGGQPGVDFDGTDDFMTATMTNDNQATSWFFVWDDDDTSGSGQVLQSSQQIGYFSGTGPPLATWAGGSNLNSTLERDPGALVGIFVFNGASSVIYWRRLDAGAGSVSSVTGNCGSNGTGTSLRIGNHSSGSWSPFDGRIAQFARWSVAISATDAQDLWEGALARFTAPAGGQPRRTMHQARMRSAA